MRRAVILLTLALLATLSSASADGVGRPVLEAETSGDTTRIWVEISTPRGETIRHLLRETESEVSLRTTGTEPSGQPEVSSETLAASQRRSCAAGCLTTDARFLAIRTAPER